MACGTGTLVALVALGRDRVLGERVRLSEEVVDCTEWVDGVRERRNGAELFDEVVDTRRLSSSADTPAALETRSVTRFDQHTKQTSSYAST